MTTYTESLASVDERLAALQSVLGNIQATYDQKFESLIDALHQHDELVGHVAAHMGDNPEAQQQLAGLADENTELKRLVTAINRALDTDDMDRAFGLIAQGVRRAEALEHDFGRLWTKIQEHETKLKDHDRRLDDLDGRLNRVQQLLDDGHDVDRAVAMAGVDNDELRTVLHLDPDTDLTDADFNRAMADWMRRTDDSVTEAFRRINTVERNSSEVSDRVNQMETTVTEIRGTSQSDSSSGSTIVALIAGVLVFLLTLWFVSERSDAPFWARFFVSFGFATAIAGLILVIASLKGGGSKSTSESSSQSTQTDEQSTSTESRRGSLMDRYFPRSAGSNQQTQSTSTDQARARTGSDNPSGSSAPDVRTTREPAPVGS